MQAQGISGSVARSVEDLAEAIHMDADTLQAALDRYSRLCYDGYDAGFGKRAKRLWPVDTLPSECGREPFRPLGTGSGTSARLAGRPVWRAAPVGGPGPAGQPATAASGAGRRPAPCVLCPGCIPAAKKRQLWVRKTAVVGVAFRGVADGRFRR